MLDRSRLAQLALPAPCKPAHLLDGLRLRRDGREGKDGWHDDETRCVPHGSSYAA
jgi:hypothetical protein